MKQTMSGVGVGIPVDGSASWRIRAALAVAFIVAAVCLAAAQTPSVPPAPKPADSTPPAAAGVARAPVVEPAVPPSDYVLGPDDILTVKVWQDEKMSADVVVRPDGKVSLSLINEIQAAGLTPEQFRAKVTEAASKFYNDPTVNVTIKQINSRRVFIQGEVKKPNFYPLGNRMTIVQAIALAGGLTEYADKSNVIIIRTDQDGKSTFIKVNYSDILKGKNLQKNNVELKVNDVVTVAD
ncbi:MAG: polysaccharide biosynthesis/export family protein [Vicinamibacterales bacterium]